MSYRFQGFRLIRMNSAVTKAFLIPRLRAELAKNWLAKHGREGVGLCSNTLYLIAYLRPNGTIHELKPPFKQFEMWQMANAPPVHGEGVKLCACRNFFDPEVGGQWKDRGLPPDHHHPMCQFSRTAVVVFDESYRSASERRSRGLSPQSRPDEWFRRQQDAEQR